MIRPLEPGRCIRRTVTVEGVTYVLELRAGGVSLRRPRARLPHAIVSLGYILAHGRRAVLSAIRARLAGKKRRRKSAGAKRRGRRV